MGGLEENDKDPEQGGGKAADVWIFIQIRRPVGVALLCVYVSVYPRYGTGPESFPISDVAATDGVADMAEVRQYMGVHLGGGGKKGGGVRANGNLDLEKVEYYCTVYYDVTDSGPV